ncbi:hypothetical protein BDQ17DRAFT_1202199, partial [Cyathus striatus]
CEGYQLIIPSGKSPHTSYPFGLHVALSLPWSYKVSESVITLYAIGCTELVKHNQSSCKACKDLSKNEVLQRILQQLQDGIHANTPFLYHGIESLLKLLHQKNVQIEFHRHQGLNYARQLLTKAKSLDDHKRLIFAIASGRVNR